jgi:hypothetical protein
MKSKKIVKPGGRDLKNPAGIIGGNQNNKMQRLPLAFYGMKRSRWSPTHNIKKLATQRPLDSPGTGRSHARPRGAALGSSRAYASDERAWEVGQLHSVR